MEELIAALKAQTEAINRLAESNMMLVDAMAQAEGIDEQDIMTTLDGTL
jgi:hypothetical protein